MANEGKRAKIRLRQTNLASTNREVADLLPTDFAQMCAQRLRSISTGPGSRRADEAKADGADYPEILVFGS